MYLYIVCNFLTNYRYIHLNTILKLLHCYVCCHIGFFFHFSYVYLCIIGLLHLFHLFLGVVFPFWSKFLNEKKWKIRIYIVEMFGSVILCSIAPVIYISNSTYGINRFPHVDTLPSAEMTFYSVLIPLAMILAVGVNLVFYTFFTIHKVIVL